jgi:integrase
MPGEIRLLLAQLVEPYHTMVLVAAGLGLRASEIMGLQWQDFNWEDLTVLIRRGVVNGRSGDTKTEASQKSLPIDPRLARSLQEVWKRTLHQGPQDWTFANKAGRPRGQQNILHRHVRPAALRAGIGKIGWHTFRHYAESRTMPNGFVPSWRRLGRISLDAILLCGTIRHSPVRFTDS